MDYAVKINHVWRKFPTQKGSRTMFRVLKRMLLKQADNSGTFFALRNIDLTIMAGEKIGIIGNNGAGKTTLLKIIAGLMKGTRGEVRVNGNMVLLAGLGIGMVDELMVKENVFLYGTIYGVGRDTIRNQLHEIIEWAELGEFLEAKFRTLSSGMRSRLAFSIVRHIEADIFLLDEALTAGNKNFKDKCRQSFEQPTNDHRTFLVSTHDPSFVRAFCNRTLWLQKGRQMSYDYTNDVVYQYIR